MGEPLLLLLLHFLIFFFCQNNGLLNFVIGPWVRELCSAHQLSPGSRRRALESCAIMLPNVLWESPSAFSRDPVLSRTAPSQHFPCWLIQTRPALVWSPWLVSRDFWLPVLLFRVKRKLGKRAFQSGFGPARLRSSETFPPRGRRHAGPCRPPLPVPLCLRRGR